EKAMEDVGIAALKDRQIGELSGGQQQRVFLARALCQEAEIFLLDEPFVGVDVTTEERI
ncbi:MAG: ATP-binding cassette domain-containing protein, partial [Saprospiraceae bacterium]|nr:ATP-binding cassette domain-containing protein [Saprospiraceae bacterium]